MYYNHYSCSYFSLRRYFVPFIWLISHLDCRLHLLHCLGVGNITDIHWRHQEPVFKPTVVQTGRGPLTWALSAQVLTDHHSPRATPHLERTWREPVLYPRVFRLKRARGQDKKQPHFEKSGPYPTDLGLVGREGTPVGLNNSVVGVLAVTSKLSFLTQIPLAYPHYRAHCLAQFEPRSPEGPRGLEILGSILMQTFGTTCRGRPTAAAASHSSFALIFGVIPLLLFVINYSVYSHSILSFRQFFNQRSFVCFIYLFFICISQLPGEVACIERWNGHKVLWESVVQTSWEVKPLDSHTCALSTKVLHNEDNNKQKTRLLSLLFSFSPLKLWHVLFMLVLLRSVFMKP